MKSLFVEDLPFICKELERSVWRDQVWLYVQGERKREKNRKRQKYRVTEKERKREKRKGERERAYQET